MHKIMYYLIWTKKELYFKRYEFSNFKVVGTRKMNACMDSTLCACGAHIMVTCILYMNLHDY